MTGRSSASDDGEIDRGAILDRRAMLVRAALATLAASGCAGEPPAQVDETAPTVTAQASDDAGVATVELETKGAPPARSSATEVEAPPPSAASASASSVPSASAAKRSAPTSKAHPCLCVCRPNDKLCDCL